MIFENPTSQKIKAKNRESEKMSKSNVVDNTVKETIYLVEGQPSPKEGVLISSERYNELKNIESSWHDARESVKAFLDETENPVPAGTTIFKTGKERVGIHD